MRKISRCWSAILCVCLLLAAVPPVSAAEPVIPYKPDWLAAEDYVVFPDSLAYQPEIWALLLQQREGAVSGEIKPRWSVAYGETTPFRKAIEQINPAALEDKGVTYEVMLAVYGYFLHHHGNSESTQVINSTLKKCRSAFLEGSPQWLALSRLATRANLWPGSDAKAVNRTATDLVDLIRLDPSINRFAFLQHPDFDQIRNGSKSAEFAKLADLMVILDGSMIYWDHPLRRENDQIVAPVVQIANAIASSVKWSKETQTMHIERAGRVIVLEADNPEMLVDGKPYKLSIAPVLENEILIAPLDLILSNLGQKVQWNQAQRMVFVTEDMSFVGNSNLGAWLLGMNAILSKSDKANPYIISGRARSSNSASRAKLSLLVGWEVSNREELVVQLAFLQGGFGHSIAFNNDVASIKALSRTDLTQLLSIAETENFYMLQQVVDWDKKWGNKSIYAWDWFRGGTLCAFGYLAGYLDLKEAYQLAEPFANNLRAVFSSWDEAVDNYMDGYAYWSRTDLRTPNTEYTRRVQLYKEMKEEQAVKGLLFDPKVWTDPVRGIGK
jgi:hypothetical protein